MEDAERIAQQRELVEYYARQKEQEGFQPTAARIFGLLMIMDKEEFTFDEIVKEMQISKSAVSTALKNLEIHGVIESVTYFGDRKRYFRIATYEADEMVRKFQKKTQKILDTMYKIIELKKDKNSKNALFQKRIIIGLEFIKERVGSIISEYEKKV